MPFTSVLRQVRQRRQKGHHIYLLKPSEMFRFFPVFSPQIPSQLHPIIFILSCLCACSDPFSTPLFSPSLFSFPFPFYLFFQMGDNQCLFQTSTTIPSPSHVMHTLVCVHTHTVINKRNFICYLNIHRFQDGFCLDVSM